MTNDTNLDNDDEEEDDDDDISDSKTLIKKMKFENFCNFNDQLQYHEVIANETQFDSEKCSHKPHFFEELFDNYEDPKPFDLSNKIKMEEIQSDITQQNILEHFSKLQQKIFLNLIQYQANILSHFQEIQHQIPANEDACKEPLQKEESSDMDETDSCQLQTLDTSSILRNLLSFSLYLNLLPNALNTSTNLTTMIGSNSSKLSTNSLSSESHNEEEARVIDDQSSSGVAALKKHLMQSVGQLTSKSSSLSEIGASNNKLNSKTHDIDCDENIDFSSSNLQYKRKRIAFSSKQYELLQTTFEHNNFPEPGDQQCIANQLTAPYRSIKMWFQNKRANARKKLMPGEKGSGRTENGEKIPGDTDTRFYCDKCPSAFICQKYLSNHTHAHSLFTKTCPKCRVLFTHDCLLNTHMKAKCSKNKDSKQSAIIAATDKVEISNEPLMDTNDTEEQFSPSILSHLSSALPLLTLLQIQRKQEEQKKLQEHSEGYASEVESNDSFIGNEKSNYVTEQISDVESGTTNITKKLPPPLIPTNLVDPTLCNSKFEILRQLLTNFEVKASETIDTVQNELTVVNTTSGKLQRPQNIPQRLYSKGNSTHEHEDENQCQVLMEEEATSSTDNVSISQGSQKRKFDQEQVKLMRRPKAKRLRRRTTVFTEAQHRILYLHFTHCNFPDPSMFRILSKLTGLTPHVIKIWFQNERSRQRRQVSLTESEASGIKEKKPYKCRDCGVEFAMPAFLVKHCMRHIPTDNVTSQARKCPICLIEFETQKLHSHFMASHNLSINMEEEGNNEKNICHLCQEHYTDLNSLSLHKFEHLKDTQYGDPPQCSECKTTFVNVLCLEAHMATHQKYAWDYTCITCEMTFYDTILLESHIMSHSIINNGTNHSPPTNSVMEDQLSKTEVNNKYFVSLLQQSSESTDAIIETKVGIANKSESKIIPKIEMVIPANETDHQTVVTHRSPSSSLKNISSKDIPLKLIPVSIASSISVGNSMGKPLSDVCSPSSLTIKQEKNVIKEEENVITFTNTENKMLALKELRKDNIKKVPNLIPIADAEFSIKLEKDFCSNDDSDIVNKSVVIQSDVIDKVNETHLYTPYSSDYKKRRRTPTHFNSDQRDILEAYYKYDNFPDPNEQLHLSEYLHVPYSVIKTWFQNTRKNHRKHLKESFVTDACGPFECSKCRVCFVSKIYIDSHLKQHNESQLHNCSSCHIHFPHQAIYDIHLIIGCAGKKSKKKNDNARQLSSVNLWTTGQFSSSKNEVCRKSFDISNITSNMHFVHVNYDNDKSITDMVSYHKCPECPTKFISSNMLQVHLQSEHHCNNQYIMDTSTYVPQIVCYSCPDCNETFKTFVSITEHKLKSDCSISQNKNSTNVHTIFRNGKALSPLKRGKVRRLSNEINYETDKLNSNVSKLQTILPLPSSSTVSHLCKLSCSPILELYSSFQVPTPDTNEHNALCLPSIDNNNDVIEAVMTATSLKVPHSDEVGKKQNFTSVNNDILKLHYDFNNFPSSKEISTIAKRLQVCRSRVAHWFQKQRGKERKGMNVEFQPPHQCKSCLSVFVHLKALKEHGQRVHNASNICVQFVCPYEKCAVKFPHSTLLETHQMIHDDNETADDKALNRHGSFLEAHYAENNFPSPMDVSFISRRLHVASLRIHWWFKERRARHVISIENALKRRNDVDGINKGKTITKECEICGASFLDEKDFEKHHFFHSSDASLVCIECGADFANPIVLETHLHSHGIDSSDDLLSLNKSVKTNNEVKFTFLQLQVLLNQFKHNNFPAKEELKHISRRIKMSIKHVLAWFDHQRLVKPFVQNMKSNLSSYPVMIKSLNIDSTITKCVLCCSKFVSSHHSLIHAVVHKMGDTFVCGVCNAQFLHKSTLDTHSLAHLSGPKLKSEIKSLEKRLKESIKRLIIDSTDVASFPSSYIGYADYDDLEEPPGLNRSDTFEDLSPSTPADELDFPKENLDFSYQKPVRDQPRESKLDHAKGAISIEQVDDDSFTEEEDDELKLVIDE